MNDWGSKWRWVESPDFAWLAESAGPMKRHDRVKLLRMRGDGMSMLVEHPEHGQQTTACLNLDLPREFKTAKGHWIGESDPRVELFLLKALDDLRAGGTRIQSSADPDLRRRTEQELLWLLERNGWGEGIRGPGFQVEQHDVKLGPPWA